MSDQAPRHVRLAAISPEEFQAALERLPPDARQRIDGFMQAWRGMEIVWLLRESSTTPGAEVFRGVAIEGKTVDAIVLSRATTASDLVAAALALARDRTGSPTVTGFKPIPVPALPTTGPLLWPEGGSPAPHGERISVKGVGEVLIIREPQ